MPTLKKDDNVLPQASDIPSMLSSFRYPRRRRISVGPQSEADAREHLANRQRKRTLSRSQNTADAVKRAGEEGTSVKASLTAQASKTNATLLTPPTHDTRFASGESSEDDSSEQDMFSALEKPRTHYDVEVVTKLIVYAGELSRMTTLKSSHVECRLQVLLGLQLREIPSCSSGSVWCDEQHHVVKLAVHPRSPHRRKTLCIWVNDGYAS